MYPCGNQEGWKLFHSQFQVWGVNRHEVAGPMGSSDISRLATCVSSKKLCDSSTPGFELQPNSVFRYREHDLLVVILIFMLWWRWVSWMKFRGPFMPSRISYTVTLFRFNSGSLGFCPKCQNIQNYNLNCFSCYFTLREEHRVLESRTLNRMFLPKKEESAQWGAALCLVYFRSVVCNKCFIKVRYYHYALWGYHSNEL